MGIKKKSAKGRLDKYYYLAKEQGYRARSAFKLIHLNKKHGFLENSKVLVDLCAAPGGWLQVAAKFMPKQSLIIGVDLVPIKPVNSVITLVEDITSGKCLVDLKKEMKDWKADVYVYFFIFRVLHDGAPNVGKSWIQDAYSQSELVLYAFKLACTLLIPKGIFVTKVFRSKEYNSLMWVFNQLFDKVDATKPASSRNVSAEIFVVCSGYKAPGKIDPKFFDPKYVFQDIDSLISDSQSKFRDSILKNHELGNRNRSGYVEGKNVLYEEKRLSEFFYAEDPIAFLSDLNCLKIDTENDLTKFASSFNVEKYKELHQNFNDLRTLNRNEIRDLLKWRKKVMTVFSAQTTTSKEPLKTNEHTIDKQQNELEEIERGAIKIIKKERKKKLEKKAKSALRMQDTPSLSNFNQEDESLFSFKPLPVRDAPKYPSEITHDSSSEEKYSETKDETAATTALWFSNPLLTKFNTQGSLKHSDEEMPKVDKKNTPPESLKHSDEEMLKTDKKHIQETKQSIKFVPQNDFKLAKEDKDFLKNPSAIALTTSLISGRARSKQDLIDDSFNRFSYPDEDLPDWFKKDEGKHNQKQIPLTKEAVLMLKDRLRRLNSKPIKKVVEAKMRKKRRTLKKISNILKKSDSINEKQETLENKGSSKDSIEKILKKASKKDRNVKMVVSKGALKKQKGRPRGVKGRYKMVDKRMLKDIHKKRKTKAGRGRGA